MSAKYPRTYHLNWSPGTTSDDRIAKSVDSLLNRRIIITEKLDGGNINFIKSGVYARSHATYTQNPWDQKMWELHEQIKDYIDDYEIFGENMWAVHSIEYKKLKSFFYMFGVRCNDIWSSWGEVEYIAYLLDFPTAPVLWDGIVKTEKELVEITESLVSQPSVLDGAREGIVVRIYDSFHTDDFSTSVMKWVRKGHVQSDEHWTKMWRQGKGQKHQLNWE